MKKILVDTSVLIEFLRVKNKITVYEKILTQKRQPVVSFITPAELWAGKSVWENQKKAKLLEKLLEPIEVVFPSPASLKLAGKLRAEYNISLLDTFIAAAAIEKNLPLATLNIKDFKKIKKIVIFTEVS